MSHASIQLVEELCTSCMICARECPTWCIRVTSHQERSIPAPGARPRTHNVLDTFSIDWSVCMYCGVCIEQCPTEALHWDTQRIPAATTLTELLHDLHTPPANGSSDAQ